jgi:hypothetical protein
VKKGYNGPVEKASHYGSFSVNLGALDRVCILFLKQFDNYASVLEIIDSQGILPFRTAGRSALVGTVARVHLN